MTCSRFPVQIHIIGALLGVITTLAPADEAAPSAPLAATENEEIKIFLRISRELFEELTQDDIQMTRPVQRRVAGMPLTGQASGEGRTSIQLDTSNEHAEFLVTVTGNAIGLLKSDVGPATAKLTTRARFTSQKRIRFDGTTFRSLPAGTSNCNKTSVDRICAKRKGPIGRLVECVGRRMADKATPEINAVAEKITQEMLSQAFDELASELITELNQTTKFEETVNKYFPQTKSWKYRLATRPDYLLAGVGPPNASFPDFLTAEDKEPEALMEMWLPLTPGQAAILELVGELDVAHDLLSEFLSEEDAKEIADDVQLVRRLDWSVIQIGLPKAETKETRGL